MKVKNKFCDLFYLLAEWGTYIICFFFSFNSQTWMVKPTGIDEDMRNDGELLADCDMQVPSTQMIAVPTEEFSPEITSYGVPW